MLFICVEFPIFRHCCNDRGHRAFKHYFIITGKLKILQVDVYE